MVYTQCPRLHDHVGNRAQPQLQLPQGGVPQPRELHGVRGEPQGQQQAHPVLPEVHGRERPGLIRRPQFHIPDTARRRLSGHFSSSSDHWQMHMHMHVHQNMHQNMHQHVHMHMNMNRNIKRGETMIPADVTSIIENSIIESNRLEFKKDWNPEKIDIVCEYIKDSQAILKKMISAAEAPAGADGK